MESRITRLRRRSQRPYRYSRVCIATLDPNSSSILKSENALSNIQEVTARSGRVIALEGDAYLSQLVETRHKESFDSL